MAVLAEPVPLAAATVRVAGLVGISTLGAHDVCDGADTLIRQAGIAFHDVKTRVHGNAAAFFDAGAALAEPTGFATMTADEASAERP